MPVRHPGKCRVKALLHRGVAVVLLGDHRPVVEAGHGRQDPVHRRRSEQTARRFRAADHHRQAQSLGWPPRRCPPQERQQPQGIRAPELTPVHALSSEEGEQAPQVVRVRTDRVRRETPIDQMIQEPAGRCDQLTVAVDQPHSPNDTAIAFLDHPHTGLPEPALGWPNEPCISIATAPVWTSLEGVQIRRCSAGIPSSFPNCSAICVRCATRPPPTRIDRVLDGRDHRSPATARDPAEPWLTSSFPSLRAAPSPTGAVEPSAHPTRQPGRRPALDQPARPKRPARESDGPSRKAEANKGGNRTSGVEITWMNRRMRGPHVRWCGRRVGQPAPPTRLSARVGRDSLRSVSPLGLCLHELDRRRSS